MSYPLFPESVPVDWIALSHLPASVRSGEYHSYSTYVNSPPELLDRLLVSCFPTRTSMWHAIDAFAPCISTEDILSASSSTSGLPITHLRGTACYHDPSTLISADCAAESEPECLIVHERSAETSLPADVYRMLQISNAGSTLSVLSPKLLPRRSFDDSAIYFLCIQRVQATHPDWRP